MPTPMALAMVVCDAVWVDPATGKSTILGTFASIHGHDFPLAVPTMAVYLALTDARGVVPLELRLVDVDEEQEPVFQTELSQEFADPIVVAELVVILENKIFPTPGEYRLQLFAAGDFLMERRVFVQQYGKEQPPDEST
jgi:hypothetical protein